MMLLVEPIQNLALMANVRAAQITKNPPEMEKTVNLNWFATETGREFRLDPMVPNSVVQISASKIRNS